VLIADASGSGVLKQGLVSDITALAAPTLGTPAATTSGTAVGFTGIPSGTKRIILMFSGVSLNGTDNLLVQIGPSGGYETTSYASTSTLGGAGVATGNSTSGFFIRTNAAANIVSGHMTLTHMGSNKWIASHMFKASTSETIFGAGEKTLAGTLDRIQILPTGSNEFDAGSINVLYD
jgi:hypothetical protein